MIVKSSRRLVDSSSVHSRQSDCKTLGWPRSRSSLSGCSLLAGGGAPGCNFTVRSHHISQHTTYNTSHITHRPLQWTSPHILITAYNTHACALLLSLVWGWWWLVPVLPLCPVTGRCKVNTRCNGQLQKWQNWNFMGNVKTKFLRVLAFSLKNPIWDKIHNWTNNAEPTSDPNSFLLLN